MFVFVVYCIVHVCLFVCLSCLFDCVPVLCGCVQTGFNTDPNEEDTRIATATWNTCFYTISCWGKSHRLGHSPLFCSPPLT